MKALIENSSGTDTVSSGEITYIGYRYPDWRGNSDMQYPNAYFTHLYMSDANTVQDHAIVYYSYSGNNKPTFELIRNNTDHNENFCRMTPIDTEVVDNPGVYSIDLELSGPSNESDSSGEWIVRGHLGNKTFDWFLSIYEFGDDD